MNFQQSLNDIATQSIGFSSSAIALSQAVYSDLVLAKKYKDVDYKPVSGLDTCVFLVQEPDSLEPLVILPILQEGLALSMKRIAAIFDLLCDSHIKDTTIEKFTFAIYASDSTILYYHIKKGLGQLN